MTAQLDARIAQCDAEITRIQLAASQAMDAQRGQKDVLQQAKMMLAANPSAEALLRKLREIGIL